MKHARSAAHSKALASNGSFRWIGLSPILKLVMLAAFTALLPGQMAAQQRVLGLDISAWQGNISQSTWNNIHTVENRQFIILRSSRGGTTGYYNQNDADNVNGLNTLSQRYDDPYYVQNMNRVVAAGMFAGSYHFSRPDIIASTLNSGGVANTGTDEADHFIQMAGPWMRPGYLMPVHDLEAGDGIRTDDEMAQFCVDFSNRIYQKLGIRPAIYINGNYAANILQTASASLRTQIAQPAASPPTPQAPDYPILWSARWPNQANPNAIDVQNSEPKDSYAPIYGPWDDYGVTHPWAFWQYASTGRLQSYNNGGSNLDLDVARGGLEFLKDYLIPAIWMNNSNGDWATLTNWNSGQTPVAPVAGAGQVSPVGTQTLPTPRLPGAAGSGPAAGSNDTVILDRPNASITVTITSGSYNIRKLYQRETLLITNGSLTVNYVPAPDSTTNGAQFSGPVTLGGNGSFAVHTLQVDPSQVFTLAGGTLTWDTIRLMPHPTTPARISITGNPILNARSNGTALLTNGAGIGTLGTVDLAAGNRTLTVGDGAADVDVSVDVQILNGALTKAGPGTLRLTSNNVYAGGTTVSEGTLRVENAVGSGTGTGSVTVDGGILSGNGTISGALTVHPGGTLAPGTAATIGKLTLGSSATLSGTNYMRVNWNGGAPLADRLVLTSGTLNYGGTLVLSNLGAPLLGGEVFTNFSAPAWSGAFTALALPDLNSGLNWDLSALTTNGTIKVNRGPVANPTTFTNDAASILQIPAASLIAVGADPDGDVLSITAVDAASTNGGPVALVNGIITYSNPVAAPDQFRYTLSDGHGGSATGVVNVVWSPAGRFVGSPTGSGNSLTLHFAGKPGWAYFLERSTNLSNWDTIWTNEAPAGGQFDFSDTFPDLALPPDAAFYRLRWAP